MVDKLDLILSQGIGVVTKRELDKKSNKENNKVLEDIPETKVLFNVNPYYNYTVDMTFLGPTDQKEDLWDDVITTKELDVDEGVGYKVVDTKIGSFIRKKKIYLPSTPIFSNSILESWTLFDILNKECPPSWLNVFKTSYKQFCILNGVIKMTENDKKVLCPAKNNIFRAFELCPLSKVKVVIIGQDPYHTVNSDIPIANGLSFSVNKGTKIPPSLANIYLELERSIDGFKIPDHGDLTSWALQGVLMMNVALTTYESNPNAHHKYWNGFAINTIHALNKLKTGCIYVLWGGPSRKLLKHINNHNLVLESRHPSPMSVNKEYNAKDKFTGNNHFVRVNELLTKMGLSNIDWNL